jgi:hypothetical protein
MTILAGGVAAAALFTAAPAAAQYYPGYGAPYGAPYGYGNPVGQVLNQVLGGGGYPYANTSQVAINQCVTAVQARLNGGYGNYGGYGYNPYANANAYAGGRVLGISRVEPRSNGGVTVRGVASSGRYGVGYGAQAQPDLTFRCRVDYRGYVSSVEVDRARSNYGYNYTPYSPYGNDYSAYGYRRY